MDSRRLALANTLRDKGELLSALKVFEDLTHSAASVEEKSDILANQVNCLWRLGRLTEARARLAESQQVARTPSNELLEAYLCVSEGKVAEAENILVGFLERHGGLRHSEHEFIYYSAQDQLGRLLFDVGRYADAVGPLAIAHAGVHDDERRRWLGFCVGVCQYWNDDWKSAIKFFSDSLPSDHNSAWWSEIQYYLGICHARLGESAEAERALRSSMPLDRKAPRWVLAQFELGCIAFLKGKFSEAEHIFEICQFFAGNAGIESDVSAWRQAAKERLKPDHRFQLDR